ncbi:hypothetical protein BX661DRAFT_57975 [Kickxella alabastrina]|uniref:Uncharacterized protein n=1 Tax=Kickxella alabastrina TaxID=61397 RepID=A0ACC1IU19_9FUNG|nr:uncharacterized protein BX661DRAFT_57975 [Kickxella alabastrina]KAI7822742.1 hypothetical protein BX661DRAFT_57975 [Kickxella alabastrina]KAJ1900924.1 hypothetical protein LPJ66_001132 [Kickxella alabastrina]KAJ1943363.1 hypothetical protein GGF37_002682 [Kickxella alabastrina]
MAQGKGLKSKATIIKPKGTAKRAGTTTAGKSQSNAMRKGRVVKATKKVDLSKHNKLQKKLVAGMTASLEQAMSVKAGAIGKLTIMKEAQAKGKTVEIKRRKY